MQFFKYRSENTGNDDAKKQACKKWSYHFSHEKNGYTKQSQKKKEHCPMKNILLQIYLPKE
jgi:hypothetical protein